MVFNILFQRRQSFVHVNNEIFNEMICFYYSNIRWSISELNMHSIRSPTSTVHWLTNGSFLAIQNSKPEKNERKKTDLNWWKMDDDSFFYFRCRKPRYKPINNNDEQNGSFHQVNASIDKLMIWILDPSTIQYSVKEQLYVFCGFVPFPWESEKVTMIRIKQWTITLTESIQT